MARRSGRRSRRVDETCRVDERWAFIVGVVAGLIAVLADAAPVGVGVVDVIVVWAAVGLVVWASAAVAWWLLVAGCALAALLAAGMGDWVWAAVGSVGCGLMLVVGAQRRDGSELKAVAALLAVNVLIRSDVGGFHGLSAIVGCGVGVVWVAAGVAHRKYSVRRATVVAFAVTSGFAVVAVSGLLFAARSSRPEVAAGSREARAAIAAFDAGDYRLAAELFDDAANRFGVASQWLNGLLARPARLVPGVSHNARAGAVLSETAETALKEVSAAVEAIDPSELTVSSGRIDPAAVAAVEAPLIRIREAFDDIDASISEVESPWLIDTIRVELDEFNDDIATQKPRLDIAVDAVRVVPQMLGIDTERRYLILFTSPAEARGLGGFIGNYAEVVVDDGRIEVTKFGRRHALERVVRVNDVRCDECPEEFLTRYGRFGFTSGPDGGVADRGWSNVTMAAHFPYVAETAAILYPQSGGEHIDGVIVMDPYVIETLMAYTGPVTIDDLNVTVTANNAAEYILTDQYLINAPDAAPGTTITRRARVDALGTLGQQTILRLLNVRLDEPAELAAKLGPLIEERRLLMWTDQPAEQDLLTRLGLAGNLPPLDDNAGFAVTVTNAGASKIDTYLTKKVVTDITTNPDRTRTLTATVTLTNNAPNSGLPFYIIGNLVDLPLGTSRLFVTFYGPNTLTTATLNNEPFLFETLTEAGWTAYSDFINIASKTSSTYQLTFTLPPTPPTTESTESTESPPIITFTQPLTRQPPN